LSCSINSAQRMERKVIQRPCEVMQYIFARYDSAVDGQNQTYWAIFVFLTRPNSRSPNAHNTIPTSPLRRRGPIAPLLTSAMGPRLRKGDVD
jgi:hypothetical protein